LCRLFVVPNGPPEGKSLREHRPGIGLTPGIAVKLPALAVLPTSRGPRFTVWALGRNGFLGDLHINQSNHGA